jgi:tetratricopeptide (TPR) repeat protein
MQPSDTRHAADRDRSAEHVGGENGKLLAAAVILARKGQYAEAARALETALAAGECLQPEALDLRARMYAQQGLYLEAESCWAEAKRLDGENPAYDRALARLRQSRVPAGRALELAAAAAVVVVLGLLLRQALHVNPTVARQLGANETSLAEIRREMAERREAAEAGDREFAANLAGLDARLSERLETFATAAETARDRDALVARLDEEADALRASFEREVARLEESRGETDAARAERIAALETDVSQLARTVAALRRTLARRVDAVESGLAERVEELEASVEQLKASPPRRRRESAPGGAADAAVPQSAPRVE